MTLEPKPLIETQDLIFIDPTPLPTPQTIKPKLTIRPTINTMKGKRIITPPLITQPTTTLNMEPEKTTKTN